MPLKLALWIDITRLVKRKLLLNSNYHYSDIYQVNYETISIIDATEDPWLEPSIYWRDQLMDGIILSPNQIYWTDLSSDTSTSAIEIIQNNINHPFISWKKLSKNPSAMKLLRANQNKIHWDEFSTNPAIFEIDYQVIRDRTNLFRTELLRRIALPPPVPNALMLLTVTSPITNELILRRINLYKQELLVKAHAPQRAME